MNRLALFSLAASALVPASAIAGPSGDKAGVSWHAMPHSQMRHGHATRHHERASADVRRERVIVHRRGGHVRGGHHGINQYPHYQRVERGFALPQHWWGPAFHIGNWGAYGLPQPMHGSRWVRYYDDALLIDGYGRVHDGRWGMNWDEYADDWGHDDRGIPVYVGTGDFHPGEEDYAWVEGRDGYAGGYGQGYDHRYGGYHQGAYGHAGYGYGYGAVVTETTVTTSPTVIEETHYVDEVTTAPRRAYRARPRGSKTVRCNC